MKTSALSVLASKTWYNRSLSIITEIRIGITVETGLVPCSPQVFYYLILFLKGERYLRFDYIMLLENRLYNIFDKEEAQG